MVQAILSCEKMTAREKIRVLLDTHFGVIAFDSYEANGKQGGRRSVFPVMDVTSALVKFFP